MNFDQLLPVILSLTIFFPAAKTVGQNNHDTLSLQSIPEVTVKAYFKEQPLLGLPASVSVIDSNQLAVHQDNSLVSTLNTVPGVRMEERSPGSYRLSIRGSLIRSPFGIRDIRIYLGDIPLTDGGGNTYLNLLDAAGISNIEILKGPEASIYGSNISGVLIIDPIVHPKDSLSLHASLEGGSYGYLHQRIAFQKKWKNCLLNISQGYQRSDGYRQNSAMQQIYTQAFLQWQYSKKAKLKVYLLFSDLYYQTPGGLTLAQFEKDPSAAEYATATTPSPITQKAAIYNKTVFGGLTNEVAIAGNLKHVISVSGSHTTFDNPFTTDYETRYENNVDLRTYLEWNNATPKKVNWNWDNGVELQQIFSHITDYGNNAGVKDTTQTSDYFNAGQYFLFSRFSMNILHRWTIEGAVSVAYNQYLYKNSYPLDETSFHRKTFDPQVMPRLAASYKITDNIAWRASVSRGYSTPTLAEIRPTNHSINTDLQPESGWDYETGFRIRDKHDYVWIDEAVFYYQLQNTLVMRQDSTGTSYFVNAGGTRQTGLESQVIIWLLKPQQKGFSLQLRNSYTFNHFLFSNYEVGTNVYSGNHVTGVPPHVVVTNLNLQMPLGFYFFIEHNYTASLPLNDANTVYAHYYNLLQVKGGWRKRYNHLTVELFAGINNLLNENYSLGDDLNAYGGRYFNAAPLRNYYGGMMLGYN